MGLKDVILRRHPDPNVRMQEKEKKRWIRAQEDYEKEQHKKKLKDVRIKAQRKAELQRAKAEGRKAGLHKSGGLSGKIGGAMKTAGGVTSDITYFMVGDDVNLGNFGMPIKGNKKTKKKKGNNDPLWDLI